MKFCTNMYLDNRRNPVRIIVCLCVSVCLCVCVYSPEIIQNLAYGEKADVWSLGCLLYQMSTLNPPFTSANMLTLATKVCPSTALHGRPISVLRSVTCHMESQLPATRHWWMRPTITLAKQIGTWFTYPGGMEGWVFFGVGYTLSVDSHPSKYR